MISDEITNLNVDIVVPVENYEGRNKNPDHYNPSVRMIHIQKQSDGSCGFHLTRSKWDPYPWVSRVDNESPASLTGVKCGDCVLEVNAEDVLGMRISEVASLVRSKVDQVSLLLWTTGMDPTCQPESLCCGPMPINFERLTASFSTIIAALECPVCMDTIPPPCIQCINGHLVCVKCSMRAEKCPVCRDKYSPGRSLIAENVYNSITDAFQLNLNESKLREKLFGPKCKRVEKTKVTPTEIERPLKSYTNTFLSKLLGKASSFDNIMSKKEDEEMSAKFRATNMDKRKSISLSTSEIFCPDTPVSILRCPSGKNLGCNTNGMNSFGTRRPKSCNSSTEQINHYEDVVQVHVPPPSIAIEYFCPCDELCEQKINANFLQSHILKVHQSPIISFGTSSAEISLPPKTPIENSSLVLTLDQFNFWLRLEYNEGGDVFVFGMMQGTKEDASSYIIEVMVTNSDKSDVFRQEMISRHQIYDMESTSWKDIRMMKSGIFYSSATLQTLFKKCSNVILRAEIKKLKTN